MSSFVMILAFAVLVFVIYWLAKSLGAVEETLKNVVGEDKNFKQDQDVANNVTFDRNGLISKLHDIQSKQK